MSPHDILNGPHRSEVIEDGGTPLVISEPLQFIPLVRTWDRERGVFTDRASHGTARKGAGV